MDVVRTHETTLADMQQFTGEANISHVGRANKRWPPRDASRYRDSQPACRNCGRSHDMNDRCPAQGSRCRTCGKINHWQRVCRQEKGSGTGTKRHHSTDQQRLKSNARGRTSQWTHEDQGRGVNLISQATGQLSESFETMAFDNVKVRADSRDEVYTTLHIKLKDRPEVPATLKVKVDTDSQGNVLPLRTCHELNLVVLNCEISETTKKVNTKEDLQRQYPDRFEGIGKFRSDFHITLDPAVTPMIHTPMRCSIHLKEEVKSELDGMEKMGVTEKVTEPTDWVSNIVYSRKPSGKLRICLDPKDLNKAIKRPHYHTPTLEEMYSKLEARHGYWSVQLDKESKLLTTFNSPFGRFCFKRMPFGLNLSQDVFQERMDHILEKCSGTISIADDIGVFGSSEQEHDQNPTT